eukprot:TRINITY_DN25697_c0_g3_i2.p1 TRINITY_DN25697_c0_g3~~TRINITY_DN25697_c0_g3_i2.p1  ORF type:complete len:231 (+),score=43.75 TRINITY_DN25697_c0_g3_i2:85-777(+)
MPFKLPASVFYTQLVALSCNAEHLCTKGSEADGCISKDESRLDNLEVDAMKHSLLQIKKSGSNAGVAEEPDNQKTSGTSIYFLGRDLCQDPKINTGSTVIVTQIINSKEILGAAHVDVACCSNECACNIEIDEKENKVYECTSPLDDVLALTIDKEVHGTVRVTAWNGMQKSECCGCKNSGWGNLHLPNETRAIMIPLEYAPLCDGSLQNDSHTDEMRCKWDPWTCQPCV